jgi:hypothetical protein
MINNKKFVILIINQINLLIFIIFKKILQIIIHNILQIFINSMINSQKFVIYQRNFL